MTNATISINNLGKKYIIHHQRNGIQANLREVLSRKAASFARRLRYFTSEGKEQAAANSEEFWALKNVSFDVECGEVIGLIGRNGAGKSTLLKVLSRITQPTTGRYRIKGRVASLLEVGTGFHPELTGRENIYLNGAILGMSKAEIKRKFDEIVAFAEVEFFLDTPVKRYSSGMYVRLAFAVAAHLEPEILLVDEVLAVGDAQFQKKCVGKMEDISKKGRTVLFVSHNMNMVSRLCSRGILLADGCIVKDGPVHETINDYIKGNHSESVTQQTFKQDPGKKQQVMAASVRRLDNAVLDGPLDIDEPLRISITFNLEEEMPGAFATAIIRNHSGDSVMLLDSRDHPESVALDGRGIINVMVNLPAPLLLPGQYSVSPAIARSPQGSVDIRNDAVAFEIVDTKSARIRRPGQICAIYQWIAKE